MVEVFWQLHSDVVKGGQFVINVVEPCLVLDVTKTINLIVHTQAFCDLKNK